MGNPELPLILIVDDNPDDFDAAKRSFEKNHLDNPISWCKSGKEALDFLLPQGQNGSRPAKLPSLILLDLNMPGMDGRSLLKVIKGDEHLRKIPVVILTTSADERDVEICYAMGASTYIQKPVQFDGLIEATKKIKEYWFGVAILPNEGRK